MQRVSPVVTTDVLHLGKYDSITKTATFLGGYSQKSQSERRQEMLDHANADQINAVSEMVLSLLRNRIPFHPINPFNKSRRHFEY